MAKETTTVVVEGRRVRLSSLDKELFPDGTTKGDVIGYYAEVADVLIPHVRGRPVTRKRWVDGTAGEAFFAKQLEPGAPDWLARARIRHSSRVTEYPLVTEPATLVWFAQMAALELHVPQWRFGPDGAPGPPDRLVVDLDPGPGAGLELCVEVAHLARELLDGMGLPSVPVTSGSKGIHLYAGLDGSATSEQVSAVAKELARALEADHPRLVVSEQRKSLREGKVLVDWSQNSAAKTTVAPYSLRGRERPWVAAPRTWEEIGEPGLAQLEMGEVLELLAERGDPLGSLAVPGSDRLARYRSMRDPERTSEPVPDAAPVPRPGGRTFVIQEHDARRKHFDFRLERDGVLVSWALPKGEPTDPGRNHLAVRTEDHPLEYASFEGEIPRGEYGAGRVQIWDSGTYATEKWREDEVIVTLDGRRGERRIALIRTDGDQWLAHLMKGSRPARSLDDGASASSADGASAASPDDGVSPAPADDGVSPAPADDGATSTASTSDHDATEHDERSAEDVGRDDERASEVPRAPGRGPREATRRDGASSSADLPLAAPGEKLAPMLATSGTRADVVHSDTEWVVEMKWDGIRAIATVRDGTVHLASRSGRDITAEYPELADLAERVEGDAVLDGEIVALDARGRPDFGLLQQRMNLTEPREVEAAARAVPVRLLLFDLLAADGRSWLDEPCARRREGLVETVEPGGVVDVPPAFDGDFDEAFATSRRLGLEGVVAKRADSRYLPGRRSSTWVKVKHSRTQEVVVVGWRPGKRKIASLLLAVPDDDGALRYAGRVGSGFTDRQLTEIAARLEPLERETSPATEVPREDAADARWVEPEHVGEVEHAQWTADGRLRHARWRGWRPDRSPEDVRREA